MQTILGPSGYWASPVSLVMVSEPRRLPTRGLSAVSTRCADDDTGRYRCLDGEEQYMGLAALITWLLTAVGGLYMVGVWMFRGGLGRPRATRLPPEVVFGHVSYAAAGLITWLVYLLGYRHWALAWMAFVLLLPAAAMGLGMLLRWLPTYRARRSGTASGVRHATGERPLAEGHFPVAVVVEHGLFAVTTVVLVLLIALNVVTG